MSYSTQRRLDRNQGDYYFPGHKYASQPLLGLGSTGLGALNVGQVLDAAARLTSDPDAYLRQKGPAIVAAADTYLLTPMSATIGRKSAPYLLKYVAPPLVMLYALSGLAAFFAYKAAKKSGAL
jgi:hypothetical protein